MSRESTFLSSVLSDPVGGLIENDNDCRRYATSVTAMTTIGGTKDTRLMRILYELKRKEKTPEALFRDVPAGVIRGDASYPTNSIARDNFIGLARKYSNFSVDFTYSNLAGLVERIATGIAALSIYDNLSTSILTGGKDISVYTLGTRDSRVNSMKNTVFVPKMDNSVMTSSVFAVIIAAAAGEGATVATDILEQEIFSLRLKLPTVDSDEFGMASVEALRLLGENMILSEQGPLFSLAVTRGIHKAISVVSHTDEGGVNRDLLRTGYFGVPFGGINHKNVTYTGIPAFAMTGDKELAAWVDSIALTTAAAVAHSDPGVVYDGYWYPTLYDGTNVSTATVDPGIGQEGDVSNIVRNRKQLLNDYPKFLEIYTDVLAHIFGANGNNSVAVRFQSAVGMQLSTHSKHLRQPTITPYFWIEPTSLLPSNTIKTPAESNSICSFGGKNETREVPGFENITEFGASNGISSGYIIEMRSARNSGLVNFLNMNPKNGLDAITLRQADPLAMIQPGGPSIDIATRMKNDTKLLDYLWVRGQSPFCAPGELMSIKPSYGIHVQHALTNEEGFAEQMHVPNACEFAKTSVEYSVGVPIGIKTAPANKFDTKVRRARTTAARELASVNARSRIFGKADMCSMPILLTAPTSLRRDDKRLSNNMYGSVNDSSYNGRSLMLSRRR